MRLKEIVKGWLCYYFYTSYRENVKKNLSRIFFSLTSKTWRLNNLYKIKSKEKVTINFLLNPLQKELEKEIDELRKSGKPLRIIVLKPRQIGCTTYFGLRNFDQCYFNTNQFCAIIAHLREKAHEIFNEIIKFTFDNLPEKFQFPAYNDAMHHLGWRTIQSQIKVTSEGHGITPNILHLTEVAHMRSPKSMISEALQGVPLKSGFVVMESTANGRGGYFYETWMDSMIDPESIWKPIFLEWWKHPDYNLPVPENFETSEEEKDLLDQFSSKGLTLGNLVFRRLKIAEGGKDKIDPETGLSGILSFHQNYPMTPQQAFIVPSNCLFNVESLNWMDLHKMKPISEEQISRGKLKVFFRKEKDQQYLIAADTSFGASKDYSVAVVLEKKTKKFMASLRGKWGSNEFAKLLYKLGKFYDNALIAVERNMGQAVLNELINHSDYDNIYFNEEFDQFRNKQQKPGFLTSSGSRNLILAALEEAIRSKELFIHDEIFIAECLNFGMINKRFEAVTGNDDCVLALAIGTYLCNETRQLQPFNRLYKPVGI